MAAIADEISKFIFLHKNSCILIKIHWNLKVHLKEYTIIDSVIRIMAWRRTSDTLLSEPMIP